MRKKRMNTFRWAVRKKPVSLTASEKRRKEAIKAACKFPNLLRSLQKIGSRAKVILEPQYTIKNYTDELIALARTWKKAGCLKARLTTLARLNGLVRKAGANPYLSLVKGPLPNLDRKRASKIAAKIKQAMSN